LDTTHDGSEKISLPFSHHKEGDENQVSLHWRRKAREKGNIRS
jgi:hypothetical protein